MKLLKAFSFGTSMAGVAIGLVLMYISNIEGIRIFYTSNVMPKMVENYSLNIEPYLALLFTVCITNMFIIVWSKK